MPVDTLTLAKKIADICDEKIARNVVVLDLQKDSIMCDYFVICNAPTRNQLNDISRTIDDRLSAEDIQPKSVQGKNEGAWILMDYGSVIVHLFLDRERSFYDLEGLWKHSPVVYAPKTDDN